MIFAGFSDDGTILDQKQMGRLFDLSAECKSKYGTEIGEEIATRLKILFEKEQAKIIEEISIQNGKYFDEETAKLEQWSQDVKLGMERTLRELDKKVAEKRQQSRIPTTFENKIAIQETLKALESKRNQLRMDIYIEQDKIDTEREKLIEETKKKLTQKVENKHLFTIKWRVE